MHPVRIAALALATFALPVVTAPVGATEPVRCHQQVATIVGTAGPDHLVGTAGDDVIAALGGGDRVEGLGGQEVIGGDPDQPRELDALGVGRHRTDLGRGT